MVEVLSTVWKEFQKEEDLLIKQVEDKDVVLWGYGVGGRFIEHILRRNRKRIAVIIESNLFIREALGFLDIDYLRYVVSRKCIVICTFNSNERTDQLLHGYGLVEDVHYVYVKKIFGMNGFNRPLTYYSWLEVRYSVDICTLESSRKLGCAEYTPVVDYNIVDCFTGLSLGPNDGVFDFGMGRGNVLCLLGYVCPNVRLGGVEYSKGLFDSAKANLDKVGITPQDMIYGDATNINNVLDNYNYIYMYNSFQGEIFLQVLKNIQKSYVRNPRKLVLVYVAPMCHHIIIENSDFRLYKQLDSNNWMRYINIYIMD